MSSVRILGPVEAWAGEERLALGGPRQVALLAVLAVNANRAVPSDLLVDALWGEGRGGARKRLQMAVARLRRALAPLDGDGMPVLRTVGGGYLLAVAPSELDAEVFQARIEQGRAALRDGEPARAVELLSGALGLWRGPPLAEVNYEEFAQTEVRRLEELRLLAVEALTDAQLQLGQHAAVIAGHEALMVEQPARERIAAQLMLALYRSGRQADALEVYQRVRAHLTGELGLQPGPELTDLQAKMLETDPTLLWTPDTETGERATEHRLVDSARRSEIPDCDTRGSAGARGLDESPRGLAVQPVTRLPVPATPFLGRARELATAGGLLRDTRLLTLTGAGGSGKTRLALRLAERCRHDYGDAVFIGFADITDPSLILPTIGHALGLGEGPGKTPMRQLQERLRQQKLLLVLDNLEQLTHGTAVLGELLSACPGLRMIVTSREPLRLTGEQRYELPLLEPEDAADLFVARARAVAPSAEIDRHVAKAVCERLDRLPLAIELAAARARLLSPAQILARLQRRLPVTAIGPRDAPRRQSTLKATIDWSYDLLSSEEQQLFTRLSVFAGGCTLAAAEAVCNAELDKLEALVDRSLINTDGDRYWMLQMLREYALDCLEQSGAGQRLRAAHAGWLVELLEDEQLSPPGWPDAESLERVAPEQENFKAALEWAFRTGKNEILARLVGPLVGVWVTQGQLQEADRWIKLVLEHQEQYSNVLAAQVLSAGATVARRRGEHENAVLLGQRAVKYWQQLGDPYAVGKTLALVAAAATAGPAPDARTVLEDTIQFARRNGLTDVLPGTLNCLADFEMRSGRLREGRSLCVKSLAVASPGSSSRVIALLNLAYIESVERCHADAERLARDALENALARGDLLAVAWSAISIAWPLAEQGQLDSSARLLGAGLAFLDEAGAPREWMEKACAAAVTEILRQHLESEEVESLLAADGKQPLDKVVRDAMNDLWPSNETSRPVA